MVVRSNPVSADQAFMAAWIAFICARLVGGEAMTPSRINAAITSFVSTEGRLAQGAQKPHASLAAEAASGAFHQVEQFDVTIVRPFGEEPRRRSMTSGQLYHPARIVSHGNDLRAVTHDCLVSEKRVQFGRIDRRAAFWRKPPKRVLEPRPFCVDLSAGKARAENPISHLRQCAIVRRRCDLINGTRAAFLQGLSELSRLMVIERQGDDFGKMPHLNPAGRRTIPRERAGIEPPQIRRRA